ncbi:hypothetical protein M9Y10_044640 [Tritrichomonas musculus]|uniref:Uncharacterized protein n=1 Tax=Tritrichomonas musculus TaxID=1915356 RepID=A0ABR2JTA1_9EUKA
MSRKTLSSRIPSSQNQLFQNTRLYGTIQGPQVSRSRSRNKLSTQQLPVIQSPKPINAPPCEPNQLQDLLKLFHSLEERIANLIKHNGSNYEFRITLSQQAAETENLFGVFYKQAIQQCGTMPVLQQGVKPGLASSTSTLKKSALPFLKKWKDLVTTLIESQVYGPDSIEQTIEGHFETIQSCLQQIFDGKPEPSDCHDLSQSTTYQFQIQLACIKNQVDDLLQNPTKNSQMKQMSEDIKEYSRRLSEAFSHELVTCGLSQADLSVLKTKIYSSCSDIIHGLKSACLFEVDIKQVLDSLDDFQKLLSVILERLNLPLAYLVSRKTSEMNVTPVSARSENLDESTFDDETTDFDSDLDLLEIIDQGKRLFPEMLQQNDKFEDFIKILTIKANDINHEFNKKNIDYMNLETSKEETINHYEDMLETERNTNQSMSDELTKLREEIETKDKELEYLRHRTEDNEFKKCLRGVAKQLGGVLKEESVNFEDDEDDDQLIQYVNALSVYVVERKCTHCAAYAKREEQIKSLVNRMVKKKIEGEDIVDKVKRATLKLNKLRNKYENTKNENKDLINDLLNHKQCLKDLLEFYNYEKKENEDLINQTLKAAQLEREKHQAEINKINQSKIEEITQFVQSVLENIISKLNDQKEEEEIKIEKSDSIDDLKSKIFSEVDNFISKYNKNIESLNFYVNCLEDTKNRLANHLRVPPPNLPIKDCMNELFHILEISGNPLKPVVSQLENDYRQALTSMDVIANRLRGIVQYETKEATANLHPDQLSNHILLLLNKTQDIFDDNKLVQSNLTDELNDYRKTLETVDLRMHKFLELEDSDLKKLSRSTLISRVLKFTDQATEPSASKNFVRIVEINEIFQKNQSIIPVEKFSDPKKYIPDFISKLIKLDKSVNELKPFSSFLDEIFNIFDCKIESFNPNMQSFDKIQSKIIEMNQFLEKVSPVQINSILFNIVQRFTTLSSVLISTLEGFKDAPFVTTDE